MLISATQLHDGHRFLSSGAAIEVGEEGEIIAIYESAPAGATHFEGIVCPGFVNAHCHLELSHMGDILPRGTGLMNFLKEIPRQRFLFTDEQRKAARLEAFDAMLQAGVVAVGDISNTTDTLDLRASGRLHFHTFVETLGFTQERAEARMAESMEIWKTYCGQSGDKILRQSITPHAPYSVSEKLFQLIDEHHPTSLLSIHNGESRAEDEWYQDKTGEVAGLLSSLQIDAGFFKPSGRTALDTYTKWLSPSHNVMFVHNTYTTAAGAQEASDRFRKAHWCLCPGANLYIEGRLPDVPTLMGATRNFCIGTDSLASNTGLSIWTEIQLLLEHFPEDIPLETALCWGTSGGAATLGMSEVIGSFEPRKKPGAVFINHAGEIKRIV